MQILLACESSGIVRDAFTAAGHQAVSCDLLPSESTGAHIIGDAIAISRWGCWDMMIAFPPCTYLCKAQLWRCNRSPTRKQLQSLAVSFVRALLSAPIPAIALENPIGHLSQALRPYDQLVHPWHFGDPHSKEICLWLQGLPPLLSTCFSPGRQPVANHVNGRMSQAQKSKIKSRFFPAVAAAMAAQWSDFNPKFQPSLCWEENSLT